MLRIGQFAQLGHVSVVTLRHYDQLGLLKPATLDPDTGYRYYVLDQLTRLHRILALKDLGFALEEIAQLLETDLAPARLRAMFDAQRAHIRRVIAAERSRLSRIEARLQQIEREETMPAYEVRVTTMDPMRVASIRTRIPIISARRPLYIMLAAYLDRHAVRQAGLDLLVLHSRHELHQHAMSIDLEVARPIPPALPLAEEAPVTIGTLPGGLVAGTIHTGTELTLGQAYGALQRWIDDNGYRLSGPARHVHRQKLPAGDPGHDVIEVQFPVEQQFG